VQRHRLGASPDRRRGVCDTAAMPEAIINYHEVFYREQGSGSVALFAHGFPFDSTMWIEQLDALSDV
jgi:hypothetical protein